MEILTWLKANIRHKKSSFVSVVILMIIISMSLTAILSVRDNCIQSVANALERADVGNLTVYISDSKLTDNLLSSVKNHSMVERVSDYSAIFTQKEEVGDELITNTWYLLKLNDKARLLSSDLTAYEDKIPQLKPGEIYITQGIATQIKCNVGDKMKFYTLGGDYEFTIKGIVEEPLNGAASIGWKQVFISNEDFDRLYSNVKKAEADETTADCHILQIYKTSACTLTDEQFKRQVNLDTGIIDNSFGSLSKQMSLYYTTLFPDIIGSILMVFIVFLMIIVFIVMGHNISTGIEMDYVNLGVLKSQGFSKGKIRAVFVLQYLVSQFVGVIIGIILAIPLTKVLVKVFQPIMAIIAEDGISAVKSLTIIFAVLVISGLFIFVMTRKVGAISPVKTISGGRSEIYFDSRIKAPICKRGLSASIALRQFTSNKRRYIGTILIVIILVFFMITMNILGNVINSKSALENMGIIYTECDIFFNENVDDTTLEEIESTISKYSSIEKKYYLNTQYFSIDGNETYCMVYKNPEVIAAYKGRAPLYENEIIITEILAENLNLKIGDKVTVSKENKEAEFIVSGYFQSTNDTGNSFAMSLNGAKRVGVENIIYAGYSMSDTSKCKEIEEQLNNDFGDILVAEADADGITMNETYSIAIDAMKAVIYLFSVIFAFVVIIMACTKAFLQEKTDIGIYKAIGFTSKKLRLQFAVRFLIISIIGSAIGSLLSFAFSGKTLSFVLRQIGVSSFAVDFTAATLIIPVSLICICFFIFAYFVSRKIKKVEIKELIY